jgi:hypothetical protein
MLVGLLRDPELRCHVFLPQSQVKPPLLEVLPEGSGTLGIAQARFPSS